MLAALARNWAIDPNYSHGFLIPPVAGYIAWQRRARLASASLAPSAPGLALVIGSLALLLGGVLAAEVFVTRVSMLGVLAGGILFVFGRRHLRILAFPLTLLALMIPLPAIVFNQIALPLQLLASRLGVAALAAAGVPALREGNVITLAHGSLEVAEACSGIRSLMSLLTLAIVYAWFVDRRPRLRLALALASVPVAVIVNGLRVGVTGVLQETLGAQAAADEFFHAFSGWLMFLAAFALIMLIHRLLGRALPAGRRSRAAPPLAGRAA